MNIQRSPVVNDEVLFRRDCDDAHLRVLAEQLVANGRPFAGVVERDDHEIWQSSLYALGDLRLVANFPDNFDVRLIGERGENQLSHKPRTIRHKDPDDFFHYMLPEGLESVHPVDGGQVSLFQLVTERFKKGLFGRTGTRWVMYQGGFNGYQFRPCQIYVASRFGTVGQRLQWHQGTAVL